LRSADGPHAADPVAELEPAGVPPGRDLASRLCDPAQPRPVSPHRTRRLLPPLRLPRRGDHPPSACDPPPAAWGAALSPRATLRRRFQFTLRSLMILTAALAILITPVAWVVRARQRMIQAREDALRAMVLEQYYRSHRPVESPAAPAELASKEARGGPAPP